MSNSHDLTIHDNSVLGYYVDAIERKITIRTEYSEGGDSEKVDIVFVNVEAYKIENDSFGTILNSIDEIDAITMLNAQWSEMEKRFADSGWPGPWARSHEVAKEYILKCTCRGFYITSSIGMEGWVIAKSMTLVRVP